MTHVTETRLPGVGVRHDFATFSGARVGVLTYRDGRRELLVFDERDPDECRASVSLSQDDAHVLADLLGGPEVVERMRRDFERPGAGS